MFSMPRFWFFRRSTNDISQSSDSKKITDERPRVTTITQVLENHDLSSNGIISSNKESPSSMFFGVSLPSNTNHDEKSLVFTDMTEVMRAVKKYKGARFKSFPKKEDAISFTLQEVYDNSISIGLERGADYPCPPRHEIIKFRKSIETGDIESFKTKLVSNPRYLATSVDTPMIVMEGYRYNALHVAAKHKQPEICKLIIEAIEDPKFMEKLYPDNTLKIRQDRTTYLLDLYLNMPDKKLSETPLHFAAKFGCLKVVEILVSNPVCDKARQNKNGLTAKDLICDRITDSILKRDIAEVFERTVFVPVLRSYDNTVQPIIGEPYSPERSPVPDLSRICSSPCSPELSIKAQAGPMSPQEAKYFHKQWKTPPNRYGRDNFKSKIRLSDADKGLERIGRELALELKAKWSEHWSVLDAWCDLSSPDGLRILEKHLVAKFDFVSAKPCNEDLICSEKNQSENDSSLIHLQSPLSTNHDSGSSIGRLCSGLENFHVTKFLNDSVKASPCVNNIRASVNGPGDQSKEIVGDCNSPSSVPSDDKRTSIFKSSKKTNCSDENHISADDFDVKHSSQSSNWADNENISQFQSSVASFIESMKAEFPVKKSDVEFPGMESGENNVLLHAESEIVSKMFEVIVFNVINTSSSFDNGQKIHSLFHEDVLPKLQCLLKLAQITDHQDLSLVHCRIAKNVCNEMQKQLTKYETDVIKRCLISYIEYESSVHVSSSDDDDDDKEISEVETSSYQRKVSSPWFKLKWLHLHCVLKFLCTFISNDRPDSSCHCNWIRNNCLNSSTYPNGDSEDLAITKCSDSTAKIPSRLHFYESDNFSDASDTDSNEYVTPPGSPLSKTMSFNADKAVTLDKEHEVYVDGCYPSKADIDMFRVIEKVTIDPVLYPHISKWKHLISSKDKKTIESWGSPALQNYRRRQRFLSSPRPLRSPILPKILFH